MPHQVVLADASLPSRALENVSLVIALQDKAGSDMRPEGFDSFHGGSVAMPAMWRQAEERRKSQVALPLVHLLHLGV